MILRGTGGDDANMNMKVQLETNCSGRSKNTTRNDCFKSHRLHTSPRTYFGGAVDGVDGEDLAQAVEQHLGQGGHQLGGGDQDVQTLPPDTHTHTTQSK